MQLKMFSVRDSKAGIYHPPYYSNTPEEAQRQFQMSARKTDSMIGQYPEDYDLYMVGSYDDQTGKIEALDTPVHLLKATAFKTQ